MTKLFYSYRDGDIYLVDRFCPIDVLMKEQAGSDGLLIFASRDVFEIVEYIDGKETGFTTRIKPYYRNGKSVLFAEMDEQVDDFFSILERLRESC